MFWHKDDIRKITHRKLEKRFKVKDMDVSICYQNAKYGDIDDNCVLLDKAIYNEQMESMLRAVKNLSFSRYCTVPERIKIVFGQNDDEAEKAATDEAKELLEATEPRWSLDDVYLPPKTRSQLDKALLLGKYRDRLFNQWHIGNNTDGRALVLNFYGASGTGKSMTGEAIAKSLGKKFYRVNYAELESKFVGETPKNIKRVFERAAKEDALIIFDEADSFLGKRLTNVTQSSDYGVNITRSVMLIELEKFDGIVIFTTNLIKNYDQAFKRRILASIEFLAPDTAGREMIFSKCLGDKVPLAYDVTPMALAERFAGITGADIKDMVLYAALSALQKNDIVPVLSIIDFEEAYELIKQRNAENQGVHVTTERITKEQYEQEIGKE